MKPLKTIGICGSLRADSYNLKLLRNFLAHLDQDGAFATHLNPALELPLMNEDLEKKPLDQKILDFRAGIAAADIVVIASPEYNGSPSPALKNAIDWASRPPANLWQGKVVALLAASPGALGGARGLIHLRTVISGIKSWVIPEQVQLAHADKAFDAQGLLTQEFAVKQIQGAAASLKDFCGRYLQK